MIIFIAYTVLSILFALGGVILATKTHSDGLEAFGFILCIFGLTGIISLPFIGYGYVSAGYKMEIVNQEFKTNYTQAQLFFASDVIDEIHELKRQRVEINGNLMGGK